MYTLSYVKICVRSLLIWRYVHGNRKRARLGNQLKREINAANMVMLDLPTGNDLRKNLDKIGKQYQDILDKFFG